MFAPGQPFQPSLLCADKSQEPAQVKHLSGSTL